LGVTLPIQFIEADELSKTERNVGGFGSTDK
jgi:dUTPase